MIPILVAVSVPPINNETSNDRFPTEWFNKVLEKAKAEGLTGYSNNEWENRFGMLFFKGGTLKPNRKLDKDYTNRGIRLYNGIASSWSPKHEHKTAVCALILRSLES